MQKISVNNFMALNHVEVQVNDLLIFIGAQASGKSTISKLIYFFKSLPQDFIDIIYDSFEKESDLHGQFWGKIRNKFYNYFGSTRHLAEFEIVYSYDGVNQIALSLNPDKSLKVWISPDFYQHLLFGQTAVLIDEVKQYFQQEDAYARRTFQRLLSELESHITTIFHEHHTPLFLPAGRNISVNYPDQFRFEFYGNLRSDLARQETSSNSVSSSDLYLMISFLEHVERIKQRFRSESFQGLLDEQQALGKQFDKQILQLILPYMAKILRGEYQQDQYGEKIYYAPDRYIYLNNASSGQQEAIRILQDAFLIILDNEHAFRVIEEPEAHLYPMAQKHLIEVLAIMLNHTDSQLIITTHSPYILSIVSNLLFATRVVTQNPLASDEVEQVLPRATWLESTKVNVYYLRDGGCDSILDRSTGLIDQNMLDEISEELGADFQELYHIHARAFA